MKLVLPEYLVSSAMKGNLKRSIPCKAYLQRLLQLKFKESIQPIRGLKLWPSK